MKKIIIITVLTVITLFTLSLCIQGIFFKKDIQIISLTEKSKIGRAIVKSSIDTPYKLNVKIKGSFNDTIVFDGIKYSPPNIDSILYNYDWYADSVWYNFDSYKATDVKLKIRYTFYK